MRPLTRQLNSTCKYALSPQPMGKSRFIQIAACFVVGIGCFLSASLATAGQAQGQVNVQIIILNRCEVAVNKAALPDVACMDGASYRCYETNPKHESALSGACLTTPTSGQLDVHRIIVVEF